MSKVPSLSLTTTPLIRNIPKGLAPYGKGEDHLKTVVRAIGHATGNTNENTQGYLQRVETKSLINAQGDLDKLDGEDAVNRLPPPLKSPVIKSRQLPRTSSMVFDNLKNKMTESIQQLNVMEYRAENPFDFEATGRNLSPFDEKRTMGTTDRFASQRLQPVIDILEHSKNDVSINPKEYAFRRIEVFGRPSPLTFSKPYFDPSKLSQHCVS